MVEYQPSSVVPVIHSFSNDRRVLKSLRKFTDPATNTVALLASDAMFAHNHMNGKFKVFTLQDVLNLQSQGLIKV